MLSFYKVLVRLSFPYLFCFMLWRRRTGKEDKSRFKERKGIPGMKRPAGDIVWMHGASVGETISMLPLIEKIQEERPELHIMVTSGTVTSASLMARRLPKGAFHQYIPIDLPGYTGRFVEYWQPKAVLWFESEFWPSILSEIHRRNIPLILINGRVSDKSFRGWKRMPRFISRLLGMFSLALGQSPADEERLHELGAPNVACEGNIKFASQPLPYSEEDLEALREQIGERRFFLAASTHHDEEERLIPIYGNLRRDFPDLLMILSPRHPIRGDKIEIPMLKAGLKTARRTKGEPITPETDVYIADTLGEMGLFYKLSPIVFIGGSLIEHGGQNFIEPMHFSDAVIVGPHMHNFRLMMQQTQEGNAVIQVKDERELQDRIGLLLSDEAELHRYQKNAHNFVKSQNQMLGRIYDRIKEYL